MNLGEAAPPVGEGFLGFNAALSDPGHPIHPRAVVLGLPMPVDRGALL